MVQRIAVILLPLTFSFGVIEQEKKLIDCSPKDSMGLKNILRNMSVRSKSYLWLVFWIPATFLVVFLLGIGTNNIFLSLFAMLLMLAIDGLVSLRFLVCLHCNNPSFKNGSFPLRWTPFVPTNCSRCGHPLSLKRSEAESWSYSATQGQDRNWLWVLPPHVHKEESEEQTGK